MQEGVLDLRKKMVVDLKKKNNIENQKARVILALDFSGSMSRLYNDGSVQELLERVLPIGVTFDSNESVEFYLFHQHFIKVKEDIKVSNINGLLRRNVDLREMGGTNYAPIINEIYNECVGENKSGFLKSLLGGINKKRSIKKLNEPVYVIFVTDGQTESPFKTEEALKDASYAPIFFQFIGLGSEHSFKTLRNLDSMSGRVIDNANFFSANDIRKMSDEELYSKMMAEFPQYLIEAKNMGML